MNDTTDAINFSREEFAASLRAWLLGFTDWVDLIISTTTIERPTLTGHPYHPAELIAPGSAGQAVENAWFRRRMLQAYDFVTTGVWDTTGLEEFTCELPAFEAALQLPLESHAGMRLVRPLDAARLPDPQAMCLRVIAHAVARIALLRGEPLTLNQVATLAGLAEKTVRMAANPKNADRLVTYKDGHNAYVDPEEAQRWLMRRAHFKPSRMLDATHDARRYSSVVALSEHLRELRGAVALETAQLASQLGWGRKHREAYEQLERGDSDLDPRPLTIAQLVKLGRVFGITDIGGFAREAASALAPRSIELDCAEALRPQG